MLPRALIVLSLVYFTGCKEDIDTITPTIGTITESVYASGVVKAAGQYQVIPTANGTLLALLVQEGDTVKAGQPLMRIDDRTSSLATNNAFAQLRNLERNVRDDGPVLGQLKTAMDQARDKLAVDSANYMRQKALWEKEIGSRSEFDQRELAYNSSRSAYQRTQKAIMETRDKLRTELEIARNTVAINTAGNDDRTPRSLIDGIVYDIMIEPGELATTQKPVAVIGSATDLYLELGSGRV
ncbi:MAG: biotin/lipoyl-binding protein [Flavobacteriales bacterium]|nr:biotin/lipoyl-binding protein [Flavobacteriales bacterium]